MSLDIILACQKCNMDWQFGWGSFEEVKAYLSGRITTNKGKEGAVRFNKIKCVRCKTVVSLESLGL